MELKEKVLNYKNEVIQEICEFIKIKSVQEEATKTKPFGMGPYNALKYIENLAIKLGFNVNNYDNYAVEIEFGEGEEVLGILCHADVVPEGEDWDFDPYGGIIDEGKIYGRGTLDDKGPTIINLYAMKCLLDSNIKLNKKVRMIVGANEESGSLCLDYYFNQIKRSQPDLAYTPDSNFPVTFAEKGILRIEFNKHFKTLNDVIIKGGNAYNSVPDFAYIKSKDINLETFGKSAHAAKPELGLNAIYQLFNTLKDKEINNQELKELINFFNDYFKNEIHGESLNINFKDNESGFLTTNIGFINLENNFLTIGLDIRVPVTIDNQLVINKLKSIIPNWINMEVKYNEKALHVDKNSFLVKTLMKIYQDLTNDYEAKPLAIGGGTYARMVNNGVAFGALLKDQVDNMHQKNEYLEINKIDLLLQIYVQAIYELAK